MNIRSPLLIMMIALMAIFSPTLDAKAANMDDPAFKRHMEQVEQWRKSIPDYDKRLFDRIKKINTRTVNIQRFIGFGLLIAIILIPIFTLLGMRALLKRTRLQADAVNLAQSSASPSDRPKDAEARVIVSKLDKARLRSLSGAIEDVERRQDAIFDELSDLYKVMQRETGNVNEIVKRSDSFLKAVDAFKNIEVDVKKVQSDLNSLDNQGKEA